MKQKENFETLLNNHRIIVERYINFRIQNRYEAEDIISETYCAAYVGFENLKNKELFKPWILSIAKNQCNMYLRKKYKLQEVSLDILSETADDTVFEDNEAIKILHLLPEKYSKPLIMTIQGYNQNEIASRLEIPQGTVKSRVYYAKNKFRSLCTPEQLSLFEKGRIKMSTKDLLCGFPTIEPTLIIEKINRPFKEVRCADEGFIIPVVGNKNSEGTYRYPEKKLACVSTCYVPKAAIIHGAPGVKICRDTYNVKANKLYKNECIWFSQLTEDYIRDLGTISGACELDNDIPFEFNSFLEENYDVAVNSNDRIHGRPLLIKENPPKLTEDKIYVDEYNVRYTLGSFDVTVGKRKFETVKFIYVQNNTRVTENYVDTNGRLVFLRWYESVDSIEQTEWYTDEFKMKTVSNPKLIVNDIEYRLIENRISEYAL